MKRPTPKNTFKQFQKIKTNQDFLLSFRTELQGYISKRPIEIQNSFWQIHQAAISACLLILVFIFSSGGVTYASLGSTPGEKLFPIKLLTEKFELKITKNSEKKEALNKKFITRRFEEIEKIEKNNPSEFVINESIIAINETLKDSGLDISDINSSEIANSLATSTEAKNKATQTLEVSLFSLITGGTSSNADINSSTSVRKQKRDKTEKIILATSTKITEIFEKDTTQPNNSTSTINSDFNKNKRNLLISRDRLAKILKDRGNKKPFDNKTEKSDKDNKSVSTTTKNKNIKSNR